MGYVKSAFSVVSYIFARFLIGFGVAYILDMLVVTMEKRLKMNRALAIGISLILFLASLAGLVIYIIPLIYNSFSVIFSSASNVYNTLPQYLQRLDSVLTEEMQRQILEWVNDSTQKLISYGKDLLNFTNLTGIVSATSRRISDLFFGLVICIYSLFGKKSILLQLKRVVYALFETPKADSIHKFGIRTHKIFSSYISGKVVDSAIILVLSLIFYSIFQIPITPFMALLAGVTNLIPYFGPIIGGIISGLIMLCFDPIKALVMLIIIVLLQSFDAFYLGPKILGDAVGIGPLLILLAVTVGGDIGGFLGMFLGVPVLAAFKVLIYDDYIKVKLNQRKFAYIDGSLPPELFSQEATPKKKAKKERRRKPDGEPK
jgi:predicted PurR-regulated permease PerM